VRGIPTLPAYWSSIYAVLGWRRGSSHFLQPRWWSGGHLCCLYLKGLVEGLATHEEVLASVLSLSLHQ
jgi:hypothetical protein